MTTTATRIGERLADLLKRAEATDAKACEDLAELKKAGTELAKAMGNLADALDTY
jgi:hypothetical protein